MYYRKSLLLVLLLLLANVATTQAETQYVTDQFNVNVRAGTGTQHRIIEVLSSGHRVEVLSVDRQSGYSQIRTEDGNDGYILTRFLTETPSARDRLEVLQQRLDALQQEPDNLAIQLDQLTAEHQQLQAEHRQVSEARAVLERQLEDFRKTFADPARIAEERDQLRTHVAQLIRQSEELQQENVELKNSAERTWFLFGAGAIVLGILIGLILPNLRVRRRSSRWDTL